MSSTDRITDAAVTRRGRHAAGRERGAFARSLFGAVPVVLVGSLALSLGVAPSEGSGRRAERDRQTPSPDSGNGETGTLDFAAADGDASPAEVAVGADLGATAPAQTMAPFEYAVMEGDTISEIAGRYGLSTASVLALNGLSWKSLIFPGQILSLNASASPALPVDAPLTRYTIAEGDTISGIAASNSLDTESVLSANGLGRDSIIFPGQTIVLPQVRGSASALDATPVASVTPIASTPVAETGPVAPVTPLGSSIGLTEEMLSNARSIVAIGRELGVGDRGIVVALAAAMQESTLRNLDWGHLDSLGLFQQRPSTGWGTREQILDTDYSIRTFFTGIHTEDVTVRGLLDIDGWEDMSVTQAAQAVQISAYPDAYAKWESDAWSWLAVIG
ncbi:LysM peptidoglycan-binding domain-containing protein [Amnibacterium flavum]|uniref:LysM domain-containing protein n=1 Tax=Amnibacterium flavum TaxID=2173173 RepID=A0A2V1HQS0_9MICO|nr:LysM domain-containing protein [Amnibacterium flavum]PVZ94691.1 hypothetical protein DDQ50_13475 [Amnibacterium flavum]